MNKRVTAYGGSVSGTVVSADGCGVWLAIAATGEVRLVAWANMDRAAKAPRVKPRHLKAALPTTPTPRLKKAPRAVVGPREVAVPDVVRFRASLPSIGKASA